MFGTINVRRHTDFYIMFCAILYDDTNTEFAYKHLNNIKL